VLAWSTVVKLGAGSPVRPVPPRDPGGKSRTSTVFAPGRPFATCRSPCVCRATLHVQTSRLERSSSLLSGRSELSSPPSRPSVHKARPWRSSASFTLHELRCGLEGRGGVVAEPVGGGRVRSRIAPNWWKGPRSRPPHLQRTEPGAVLEVRNPLSMRPEGPHVELAREAGWRRVPVDVSHHRSDWRGGRRSAGVAARWRASPTSPGYRRARMRPSDTHGVEIPRRLARQHRIRGPREDSWR
jgi:hypothetical protein